MARRKPGDGGEAETDSGARSFYHGGNVVTVFLV